MYVDIKLKVCLNEKRIQMDWRVTHTVPLYKRKRARRNMGKEKYKSIVHGFESSGISSAGKR